MSVSLCVSTVQTHHSHQQHCERHVSIATLPTEQMRRARKSGHAGAMADARHSVRVPVVYVSAATKMLHCVLTTLTWPTGNSVGQTQCSVTVL